MRPIDRRRFVQGGLLTAAGSACYVATNPGLQHVSGCYFSDRNPETPSASMRDQDMAARLWDLSEELTRDFAA